ncbi:MAG: response regulator [Chloroflexi bacterium]|nr:response regulator [Chloroflexota bacterium]
MNNKGARILAVDDEPEILRAVRINLAAHGFEVTTAGTGQEAIAAFQRRRPDLVLLDLGLPDADGTQVIQELRELNANTPIIVLSVRDAEREKVKALNLGADDYLTKPFGMDELLARIRVVLRRLGRSVSGGQLQLGDLSVDLERRRVTRSGTEVHLRPTEWELLKVFVANPDKVLTHRMLLQQVWGPEYGSEGHYLHVYVASLRKKLESDPQKPRHLLTEPGVGYRFRVD